jgi:predicted nicotinamide N-methyase
LDVLGSLALEGDEGEVFRHHETFTQSDLLGREERSLLARIKRRTPVEHTTTVLAGRNYPWTQVVDPDRLLEQALLCKTRQSHEVDPFWAATWRAASGLDDFMDRFDLADQRVLELGCGSGRVGIGAALRGACVMMTDVVGSALLVARFNARLVKDRVTIRRLEWRHGQLPGPKFSYILGSDIVYDPALHPILEPCLRRHLAQAGVVLLSEPQRHTGDRFRNWIMKAGWRLNEHYVDLGDNNRQIRIFELRLLP